MRPPDKYRTGQWYSSPPTPQSQKEEKEWCHKCSISCQKPSASPPCPAKLLEVELLDSLEQRLELLPVDAHHDEHTEDDRYISVT